VEFDVVRLFGGLVVCPVTIDAGHTRGPKPYIGFTDVAGIAVDRRVHPHKWEGSPLVQLSDIFHDP